MSTEWYYAKDNQQLGPIPPSQLKILASSGQLSQDDLVWKEGMPEWQSAGTIKGLFAPGTTPAAAAPVAAARAAQYPVPQQHPAVQHSAQAYPTQVGQSSQISYYNPTGTASILKGFPHPTGSANEWPLDRHHLEQLKQAESHRKHIRNCGGLFSFLFVMHLIVGIVIVIGGAAIVTFAPGRGGGRTAANWAGGIMAAFCAVVLGLALLAFFSKRAVLKCRLWAPIVWLVYFALTVLWIVLSATMSMSAPRSDGSEIVGAIFALVIQGAFVWIIIRAMIAIPKFLASPVWCQEALVNAKL